MTRVLWLIPISTGICCFACGDKSPTTPLVADSTFEFQLGQGSGLHGLNLVKITAAGEGFYDYPLDDIKWQQWKFHVDNQTMEKLVEKINNLKIMNMKRVYEDPNVADGTQWCLLIKGNGNAKSIYFNNKFPDQIKQLADYVHNTVMGPMRQSGKVKSGPLPEEEFLKHQREIWDSIQ